MIPPSSPLNVLKNQSTSILLLQSIKQAEILHFSFVLLHICFIDLSICALLTFIIQIQMQAPGNRERAHKTIKRRIIKHGRISEHKRNQNCPKLIIAYCFYLFKEQILLGCDEEEKAHARESFQLVDNWVRSGLRETLSRAHLIELFGPAISQRLQIRNYINSKIFYKFLAQKALEIILENKKIEDPISYLFCLQKWTARLANPKLALKVQFK